MVWGEVNLFEVNAAYDPVCVTEQPRWGVGKREIDRQKEAETEIETDI